MSKQSSSNNHVDDVNHTHDDDDNSTTSLVYPISVLDRINNNVKLNDDERIWSDDRIALQKSFTLQEKGWQVSVEWKPSPQLNYTGIGVFVANQSISAGTILRIGILHDNLLPLNSVDDIETFCNQNGPSQYQARLQYVQDYLWGYYPSLVTNENGYPTNSNNHDNHNKDNNNNNADERFFGMWIPGNGLNHNQIPNTVYRNDDHFFSTTTKTNVSSSCDNAGTRKRAALYLIALCDIQKGDELYDDYRRHGTTPPIWLKNYAIEKNITLNFADCNDFVL